MLSFIIQNIVTSFTRCAKINREKRENNKIKKGKKIRIYLSFKLTHKKLRINPLKKKFTT